jgi:Lectin C-type domain
MPVRLALLGCLAVLASSGCSLLLDGDALTRGDDNARSAGGTAGHSSAGTAGQGAGECTAGARDTCDGRGSDCKPSLDEPSCPAGCDGIVLNGTSYMACAEGATFNEAELLCQAQSMHVIRIDDGAENNVTVELAQNLGSYIWIGASSLAEVGSYAWLDGTVFFRDGAAVDGVYQNFDTDQPVEGAGRNCVQLHNSADGPWSSAPCSDVKPYVCERF